MCTVDEGEVGDKTLAESGGITVCVSSPLNTEKVIKEVIVSTPWREGHHLSQSRHDVESDERYDVKKAIGQRLAVARSSGEKKTRAHDAHRPYMKSRFSCVQL